MEAPGGCGQARRLVPLATPASNPSPIIEGTTTVAPLAATVLMKPPARPQMINASRVMASMTSQRRNSDYEALWLANMQLVHAAL